MTDATTRNQLTQAYTLIQNDKLDEAITILKPIVTAQPDNADAWWLMANAVSEPPDAYNALSNVLRLEPNHSQAKELLDGLLQEFPDLASQPMAAPAPAVMFSASPPTVLDDLFTDQATPAEPALEPAKSAAGTYDLDSFFNTPAAADSELDAVFSSSVKNASTTATEDRDLDNNFFGKKPQKKRASAPEQLDDPFADAEPSFMQSVDKPAKPARAAKGKAAPKSKAALAVAESEPVPMDPLEIERRANRRTSPVLSLLLLLVIIAAIGGAAYWFVIRPRTQPIADTAANVSNDPAAVALKQLTQSLADPNANPQVVLNAGTIQVTFCGLPGPKLRDTVRKAMDAIADPAALAGATLQTAQIEVDNCKTKVALYRVQAPIAAITTYVDGNKQDKQTYYAAWTAR